MSVTRKGFFKLSAGAIASAVTGLGLDLREAEARVSELKITHAKVTKTICPYCSVSCGALVYTQTDGSLNVQSKTVHVEGNPDDPINRGTLCPKGAALKDFLNAEGRLTKPMYRAPGATAWTEVTWDDALDKIARLVKNTRDRNFITNDEKGAVVNRTDSISWFTGSQLSNEEGYLGVKLGRALGLVTLETQARV